MKWFLLLTGVTLVLCETPRSSRFSFEENGTGRWNIVKKSGGERSILAKIRSQTEPNNGNAKMSWTADEEIGGDWIVYHITSEGAPVLVFQVCIEFLDGREWYGGPQQTNQYWPIQNHKLERYSSVTKWPDNAAIAERYWLNSGGQFIYVHPEAPLFVDYNNIRDNHICLNANITGPYSHKRTRNVLNYDLGFFENPKYAHQYAVRYLLGKPSGIPDYRMIKYPIWSTWARYSKDITQESLWEFANEIADSGFPNAQLEIDDLWEICYGSLTVDEKKFPDLKQLVKDIKGLGFRVTIWVHPFINKNCNPWYSEALDKGYLVLNEEGSPDTWWWNNNGSVPGYIDFTNPEAAVWFSGRVHDLIVTYDIDSFKFDAGESSWSPQIPVQRGDIELHPENNVVDYVRTVAAFGPMIEIRTGRRTQDLPVFVRMVDKDTLWGWNNGLRTVITTLLQMNLNGYTLVLPDMIGGNGYNAKPTKELFIRWVQANVFMPSMQYSFVPWDHDNETVEICRRYTELHAEYADEIVAAMEASVRNGTPVNPPIWWIDPTDSETFAISDEFLLGEKILSAPVVEEGAVSRDIYLPRGNWRDGVTGELHVGPLWLKDYPAPLDTLPYFILED